MSKIILAMLCSTVGVQAGLSKIDALGMIESGNNDAAVGTYGEVSRFQIKPHIWREYTSSRSWRDVRVSASVATGYLSDLENTFRRRSLREPTDFDLYVLWNAGPSYYAKVGFSAARVHPVIRERAERYVNLRRMNNAPPATARKATPASPQAPPPALPAPTMTLAQALANPWPRLDGGGLKPSLPGLPHSTFPLPLIPAGPGDSGLLAAITSPAR